MKHLSILILIFFCCSVTGQSIWRDTFLFEITTSPRDLEIRSNGQLMVGGYYFNAQQERTTFSLNVNSDTGVLGGFTNCENPVFCDGITDVLHIQEGPLGSLYISGNQQFGSTDYLAKLVNSESLEVEWIRDDLNTENVTHINAIQASSDGVIAAIQFANFEYGLIKFGQNGETVWNHRIPVNENVNEARLFLTSNESVIILYREGFEGPDYITMLDKFGAEQWTRTLEGEIWLMEINRDDDLIIVELERNDLEEKLILQKYNIESEERIVLNEDLGERYPLYIEINTANHIFLASNAEKPIFETDVIYLDEYDSTGGLICEKEFFQQGEFDELYNDVITDMEIDASNRVFLLGRRALAENGFQRSVLLIAAESCSGSSVNITEQDELAFYPNPSSGSIHLKNSVGQSINIYDVYGKLVHHQNVISNAVDLTGLSPGLYILEAIKNKKRSIGRVIVE